MMRNLQKRKCILYLFGWIVIVSIKYIMASSSDTLIIRHGRSRVRHSSEKSHIRWGLQAFDNLTLYDYDYETSNGTSASNETMFDLSFGGNQTLFGSDTFGYLSSEITFTNGSSTTSATSNTNATTNGEWRASSTRAPANVPTKKKLAKKQIMESIRKNVEEGLEYLRTHAHLAHPTAVMPSERALLRLQSQQSVSPNTNVNGKPSKSKYTPQPFESTSSSAPALDLISRLMNAPQSSSFDQDGQHHTHNQHTHFNGRKSKTNIKRYESDQIDNIASDDDNDNAGNGNGQDDKLTDVMTNHGKHVQLDVDMQSDDSDASAMHAQSTNEREHDNKQMQKTSIQSNDMSSTPSAALAKTTFDINNESGALNANDMDPSGIQRPPNSSKTHLQFVNEMRKGVTMSSNSKQISGDSTVVVIKANDTITLPSITVTNSSKQNDSFMEHGSMHSGRNESNEMSNTPNHQFDELNDEQSLGDEGTDDSSAYAFDTTTYEQNTSFDGKSDGTDDATHLPAIFRMEDIDLQDLDETSRNNRINLMRGRDVVTKFLQIVESQHLLGANCTAGTALNLGDGIVDRYAQDRFRVEAEVAVNRANMLTRIFKLSSQPVQMSEHILHASVLSMVEFDDDIYAAGHCFDWNQHMAKRGLFCPFAHRLQPPELGAAIVKDLATEYPYLGNTSEFFFQARKNAEKVIAKNEQYLRVYHLYSNSTDREMDETLSVRYEDGRWSKPYYDCGGANIWMLTYAVPFFGYENGTYFFKGTSGIDIDLRRVDIDQCPQLNVPPGGVALPLNIFAGTDKCKQRTTECEAIPGLGFRRGSYKCVCRKGFYFPDTLSMQKYFNGSTLEEEYEKLMLGETALYNNANTFQCLPCAEGCDSCKDASPCVAALNWPMRTSILVLACAVIGFLPPAAWFTFRYQQVKILRAASPALLRVIALGAFFIYCTSIVMYPPPSIYTCTARVWLREIGFSLTYGALMLKTWRISVVFRVRSAKAVKITDASLLKRLGIICLCVGIGLLIRTIVAPPVVIVGRTADDLKAYLCKADWWDHTFTTMEVLFLAWGVRLCIMVRKAPSEFNESRFISMAIYNEFFLTCFLNVSMLFLQSPANPDLLYIIFFCHTQLTVTLLLVLIFGSKVYLVFRSGGKSHEEAIKSSGAKFVCRSQVRSNPYASATSSSTQHGASNDQRLTEQEASDEIRSLLENFVVQLQAVKDRVPARGSAIGTIGILLDNCKPLSNPQALLTVSTLPVPSNTNNTIKSEHTRNGSEPTSDLAILPSLPQSMPTTVINLEKQCVDKSTNTTHTTSNGNSIHYLHTTQMPVNQTNGTIVGQQAHPSNTDAAVETTIAATAAAIACNQPHSTDQIICDSVDANRQLSFRNLNLKCMCSGEIEPASGEQQALAVDDATADNQISDAQSRTVDDNQQCSHCGRGHCCFFLRCCHCMATEQSEHNKDVGVNVSVTGEDDQSPIVCGNNNVNSKVAVDRNASVRSIASRRCDEICNIRRTALDAGSFCETAKLAEPCSSLSDTKCCDPIDRDAGKCHCRWYCVQECVSDTNETKQCESVERSTSNLQVAPIEIEEKLIRKDASVDDENRLRCCRCSRELF